MMRSTAKFLNDEHMRLYEWNGINGAMPVARAKAQHSHAWRASYGVLAVLTTLLILNGCDADTTAERSAEERAEQTAQAPGEQPMYDESPMMSSPSEAGAPAAEGVDGSSPSGATGDPAPGAEQSGGTTQP